MRRVFVLRDLAYTHPDLATSGIGVEGQRPRCLCALRTSGRRRRRPSRIARSKNIFLLTMCSTHAKLLVLSCVLDSWLLMGISRVQLSERATAQFQNLF